MDDLELERIYKVASTESHIAGLRAVFSANVPRETRLDPVQIIEPIKEEKPKKGKK